MIRTCMCMVMLLLFMHDTVFFLWERVYVYYVFLVQIRGESLTSKWVVGCDGFLEFRCYYFMVLSPKYMTPHVDATCIFLSAT